MFIFLYTSNYTGGEVVNQLQILNVLRVVVPEYTRDHFI